jgi:hypothetical protein
MSARVSHGRVDGFDAVILENPFLRAVVIPALGGRVWELEDRVRGRHWIWHREDVPLQACEPGASYDDVWAGGWEELFPNDAAGPFEGRALPDHGEWWTLAWTVALSSGGNEARLRLTAESTIVRAALVKEFVLPADRASLAVEYGITSREAEPFHFLFKQHLPVSLTTGCRLRLPGGRVDAVDPSFGTVLPGAGPYAWPLAREGGAAAVDLQIVPARETAAREFVYVRDLPDGWCGVDDLDAAASIRMHYDRPDFPFVWLFLSYGGWRNVYTAVLEPCTNVPKDLAEAVRLGQAARLAPGATFRTRVAVTLGSVEGRDR